MQRYSNIKDYIMLCIGNEITRIFMILMVLFVYHNLHTSLTSSQYLKNSQVLMLAFNPAEKSR